MRLTTYTDYSLRMLIYLGLRPEGETSTIQEIADAYDISKNHLMKVAHNLGLAGWVETIRGRSGGLRLGKPPGEINVGAVVRAMEEDMALVECFTPETNCCAITQSCRLQRILREALQAYLSELDRYTLADLLDNQRSLATELRMPAELLSSR